LKTELHKLFKVFARAAYTESIDSGLTWTEGNLPAIPDSHGMGAFRPDALQNDSGTPLRRGEKMRKKSSLMIVCYYLKP
jgi:hypothetical protein